MVETLRQDVRYALRTFRKNPAFTAVALVLVVLGIGATTAIFSVVDAVLLKSLPYEEPDRLVRVSHAHQEAGLNDGGGFSPQDFEDLAVGSDGFAQLASYLFVPGQSSMSLVHTGAPQSLEVAVVSGNFFDTLGRRALRGRTLLGEDAVAGKDDVIVLSHSLWQRRFAGEVSIVGRTVTLEGDPLVVVGVMPASFRYPSSLAEAWVPISRITEDMIPSRRDVRWRQVFGRLAPDATLQAAATETRTILGRLAADHPDSNEGWTGAVLTPLRESMVGDVAPALLVLFGATAMVLLVACANLANLLLARATGRRREMAIRASLGAGRWRLVRQLLTESVLLASAGGALGLALAIWGVDVLVAMSAGTLPLTDEIGPDPRLVGFALLASLVTGVAFGLAPALTAAKWQPALVLREEGSASPGGRRQALRNLMVVAETALAVLLVIGSGLMLKSFWKLVQVDPGFDTEQVLTASLKIPADQFDVDAEGWTESLLAYQNDVLTAVRDIPGVVAVGASKTAPLSDGGEPVTLTIQDPSGRDIEVRPDSGLQIVTPGYFEALGITVLKGRVMGEHDSPMAMVVNRSLAERFWPGRDPVGERLGPGEVIGVVADVHHQGVAKAASSAIYVGPRAAPRVSMNLFVRTAAEGLGASGLADVVRQAIWSVNPGQPISDVVYLEQAVADDVAQPRFFATLLAAFAALALVLAALGIYGVVSYSVGQRTHELGVRMALGARGQDVLRLVVYQSMAVCGTGLVLGLVGAVGLSRILSGLLYGVEPRDPSTFATVAVLLFVVSFVASFIPALATTRLDPVTALRRS